VVVVPDASVDERFLANPFVTGELARVKFYASAPMVSPDGTVIGRLCVFDDQPHELTGQRARVLHVLAERVVDVLELQLHRSNELLALFAGQVSHDLRSPLTAVLANSELLLDEPAVRDDPSAAELARACVSAGQRMADLIDSILAFTRVGASLDLADVDVQGVLGQVVADLAPAIDARGAKVEGSGLPTVRADPNQLYAVLLNLVSNAVKFVPARTIPLVAVTAEREGPAWRITVTDNGAGIASDLRSSVFGLYARGTQADGPLDGSGIGLATARRIVEAHGGQMGIDAAADGGAAVWFTLPAATG
jgi:signal transduction histidine kinase